MKKKAIVINDVDDADSIMDDVGCRRFMVNAASDHTCTMSEKIDVPIICLDEDDDDDDTLIKIDENYKVFLDHLRRADNNLSTRFEVDSGESDTRNPKFNIFSSCDSKRSKLGNENPMKNRVHQQSKRRKTVGFKAGRVNIIENIQRDNRVAERRKRRIAELEAARTSRAVPSLKSQQDIQQRDNIVRKIPESKAETLRRDVPFVRSEQDIRRDNTVSQGRKRKNDDLMADSLRRDVPFVRTEQDIQREDRVAAETSKAVHVEPVNRDAELKDVDETSRRKEVFVETRKKNEGSEAVVDKDYMRYLTWLVDSLTDSTTKPMENLPNDQSDLDPPSLDTLKESTMVPEKDPLVKVKVEKDLEWSDYIIEIGDSPFLDGECTPFVASKKVVDLDQGGKENESSSCWFRKKLMDVLGKPYDEGELKRLHLDASIHRRMTRCRELRKGRETDYETDELGQSYLENFPDFEKEYKLVDGVDKARALKLLRGFFFYLNYVSHDGAFKPWEKNQW